MVKSRFQMDDRMKKLWKRSTDLSKNGKRNVYVDNAEFLSISSDKKSLQRQISISA